MSKLVLDCGPGQQFEIDPSAGPGNLYPSDVAPSGPIAQAMVFEGVEALQSGGVDADKLFWNVALGLNPAFFVAGAPSCTLRASGAASEGPLASGSTPANTNYPYVTASVVINSGADVSCGAHPLGGSGAQAGVAVAYTGVKPDGTGFASASFPYVGARVVDGITTTAVAGYTPPAGCGPGLTLVGTSCVDTNACAATPCVSVAVPATQCTDLPAPALGDATGRTCSCPAGFAYSDTSGCVELDACAAHPCAASGVGMPAAVCVDGAPPAGDAATDRVCTCPSGFAYDPALGCRDIDECAQGVCGPNTTCDNFAGGHQCLCAPGTIDVNGDDSSCVGIANVAAGLNHTCAVTTTGQLYCWGSNTTGQLGDASTTARLTPTRVGTASIWSTASVSGEGGNPGHSCAVTTTGDLYCWGKNATGQLGVADQTQRNSPTLVGAGWASVAAGTHHTCGIKTNGTLHCWGSQSGGKLGNGALSGPVVTTPLQIGALTTWTKVAAAEHTCGIAGTELFCWGINGLTGGGRVGNGTTDNVASPYSHGAGWSAIGAGYTHTCAVRAGQLWCWGANGFAQLGDNTLVNKLSPTLIDASTDWSAVQAGDRVSCGTRGTSLYCWGLNTGGLSGTGVASANRTMTPTLVPAPAAWSSISLGYAHACGLSGGGLYCWGVNQYGQIGNGATLVRTTPGAVGAGTVWTQVAGGTTHTCGIKSGGLYCWGANNIYGQLGHGALNDARAVPSRIGTDSDWTVVNGNRNVVCGIRSGLLFCWGEGSAAAIGNSSTANQPAPVQIGAGLGAGWSAVSSDASHTCGIHNGAMYCWGTNNNGQVGDNSTVTRDAPTAIAGTNTGWTAVSVASGSTCALRAGGLYCWGYNGAGQFGNGTTSPAINTNQLRIGAASDWSAIAMADNHACGLRGTDLYCWGTLPAGSLQTTPQPILAGTSWASVGMNGAHDCAVTSGGQLWCWGTNPSGELGDGTQLPHAAPAQVGTATDWSLVGAGVNTTCGVRSGALYCWGQNSFAQLGVDVTWSPTNPQF